MARCGLLVSSLPLLVLIFAVRGQASSYFKPECPIPPPGTNYVAGPNTRSTLGILWDCLSIIILCTWNIQHLNVPAIQPRARGILPRMWQVILKSRVKIKWMIFTVFVPEYLVGKALSERAAATDAIEWNQMSMTQRYLANMGYFVLDLGEEATKVVAESPGGAMSLDPVRVVSAAELQADDPSPADPAESKQPAGPQTVLTKELKVHMPNRDDLQPHARLNLERLDPRYRYWALDSQQWSILAMHEVVELSWLMGDQGAQHEGLDRGGALVKALALVQVAYLIVQLIARKVGGLPSTQLEITALAFAASSTITYLFYWNRPQGIETIQKIKLKDIAQPSFQELKEIRQDIMDRLADDGPRYLWYSPRSAPEFDPALGPAPIPNDCSYYNRGFKWRWVYGGNDEVFYVAIGALVGGSVFGGLHCLAWNFEFPTPAELLVWRICSVAITCLPPLTVLPLGMWMRLHPAGIRRTEGSPRAKFVMAIILVGFFLLPYVLARLFLLVEVFRSLLFLPPEAFVDTWSGAFPHWG